MKLSLVEAAALLSLPEAALERLAREGTVPCQRVGGEPWFHRAELLEWATERGTPIAAEPFGAAQRADDLPAARLARALTVGGIHHDVAGEDREAVLRAVVERLPVLDADERELLGSVLLAREALGSTAVGEGIAIPHARAPILLGTREPSITLCFLAQPVPFAALDHQPVHTLFSLVTHTVRGHLQLLARLAAALQDPGFRAVVRERAPAAVLLAEAGRLDLALGAAAALPEGTP
jgi:PTS system nitrogen regulatory IIA component